MKDGGHADWKVQIALQHKCPACESLKAGGTSSGQVPPAATHALRKAWQSVAIDAAEWHIPGSKKKIKFVLFTDMATKLRVVAPLMTYDVLAMKSESAEDVIQSFAEKWLAVFPKPEVAVMDAAYSFSSNKMHDFLSSVNILPHFVAEKEAWAHGVAESSVQDVKRTATAIQLEALDQNPHVTLYLAVSALNSTEYTAGFSAFQWAYGQSYHISDEDVRTFASLPDEARTDFNRLVTARERAEEVARRTRSLRVLSKLSNTTVRQPLRTFKEMDLVKIWRRYWPAEVHQGPRGGLKKSGKPHWVGPGRVVFHEVLPHQDQQDHRRHLVWVLVGSQLHRCSVHSVRPVTETERFAFETSDQEDFSKWSTLADILPRKDYVDVVPEEPDENELELPDLPVSPDRTTMVDPSRRVFRKSTPAPPVDLRKPPDEPASSSTTIPASVHEPPVNDYLEPDPKRQRQEPQWVENLYLAASEVSNHNDLFTLIQEAEDHCEFMKIEFAVEAPSSNRQKKLLERSPVAYLVNKMKDAEVSLTKLSPRDRRPFLQAKAKEWTASSRMRLFDGALTPTRSARPMTPSGSREPAGS